MRDGYVLERFTPLHHVAFGMGSSGDEEEGDERSHDPQCSPPPRKDANFRPCAEPNIQGRTRVHAYMDSPFNKSFALGVVVGGMLAGIAGLAAFLYVGGLG